MKIFTTRSVLLLGLFFAFFTHTTAFAQWKKQTLPSLKRDIGYPIVAGKNVMWSFGIQYVPDTTGVKPLEFVRTTDGGKTYDKGIIGQDYDNYGIDIRPMPDGNTAYFIASHLSDNNLHELRKTTDGGKTWTLLPFKPHTYPDMLYFYDANNGLYVADPDSLGMVVMYTNNGGQTFMRVPKSNLPAILPHELAISGFYRNIGDVVFMYTYDAETFSKFRVWRSIDRGRNWTSSPDWVDSPSFPDAGDLAFSDASNGILLPYLTLPIDHTWYTEDGGVTWKEGGKIPGVQTYPIANIPGTNNFIALFGDTQRGKLFSALTNDNGKTWNTFKDVAPYTIDSILSPDFAFNFANLDIYDNHTAWARFSRKDFYRYDSEIPIVPEQPDLDLQLKADNDGLPLYGYVKYTLSVTNKGISPATGVKINWLPPYKRTPNALGPYAYVSAYADKGRYDSWNGVWTLDKIDAGAIATASFHLFVLDNTKDVTQTAQVTACNEKDLDSSPNNMSGAAKEDDEIGYVAKAKNSTADMPNDAFTKSVEFAVSPNPAKDKINISINPITDADWSVRVLNSVGQTVFNQNGQYNRTLDIDAKNFENGLYLVEYQAQGERRIEKIIVQH